MAKRDVDPRHTAYQEGPRAKSERTAANLRKPSYTPTVRQPTRPSERADDGSHDIDAEQLREAPAGAIDYDVRGIVGVRLLGASPQDAAAVDRQLGPVRAPLAGAPDVVVRFVDRLPLSSPMRYVGLDDAGFTDDAFLVLRGSHASPVTVQVPLEDIGGPCEIVCESGVGSVPLLIPVLNLTALAKGVVPLHAAAFTYEGTGVLVTGWAKGGKTETLLAFMARGARYVGDEWVYVDADGYRLYGLPEPIKLWDWHFPDLPRYRELIGWSTRSRLSAIKGMQRAAARASGDGGAGALGRTSALLGRQLYTRVPPDKLFGSEACAAEGMLDRLVFVVSEERQDVRVEEIDAEGIAERMAFSLRHERLDLLAHYLKFRFAFPDAANAFLDRADDLERELLEKALRGKQAYAVYHPFPAPIPALFDAIAPAL